MYRSDWELDIYVRDHIRSLAQEHRACAPLAPAVDRSPRPLTRLRSRLGRGLIQLGQALAGDDAARRRPATWVAATAPSVSPRAVR